MQNKIFQQIIAGHETGAAILVPESSRQISSLQLGTKPSALGCSTRLPCARTAGNCSLHLNGEIRSGFARHLARDRAFYSKRELKRTSSVAVATATQTLLSNASRLLHATLSFRDTFNFPLTFHLLLRRANKHRPHRRHWTHSRTCNILDTHTHTHTHTHK